MATLHLIFNNAGLATCAELTSSGDCVLLLDAALRETAILPRLADGVRLCAIVGGAESPHAAATIVTYDDFVALAASHERVVSWD